jgi:uncharacterized protein with ParB-like and HNH nuclease domain
MPKLIGPDIQGLSLLPKGDHQKESNPKFNFIVTDFKGSEVAILQASADLFTPAQREYVKRMVEMDDLEFKKRYAMSTAQKEFERLNNLAQDSYTLAAAKYYRIPYEEVTTEQRNTVKRFLFATVYGFEGKVGDI